MNICSLKILRLLPGVLAAGRHMWLSSHVKNLMIAPDAMRLPDPSRQTMIGKIV